MRQLLLDLIPPPHPTLANFVPGVNAAAVAALAAWLAPENREILFLVWGPEGSGRSHLLRAPAGFAYADSVVDPSLSSLPADSPALAVDNVEALDADGQVTLFNHFNRLRHGGGKLLVAAAQPPAALSLREDLRTRLGSGLIFGLIPLSDAEKTRALRDWAAARGVTLAEEATDYLLRHARRDMGSLMAIVEALDRASLERQRPITLSLLRDIVRAACEG